MKIGKPVPEKVYSIKIFWICIEITYCVNILDLFWIYILRDYEALDQDTQQWFEVKVLMSAEAEIPKF
jgi:hypothetical protein